MKTVMCNFSMFDLEQNVYIYDDETQDFTVIAKCTFSELGTVLAEVCFANDIHNIHLFGNETYLERVINEIDTASELSYSKGRINVEVN